MHYYDRANLFGEVFGRLTVVARAGVTKHKKVTWLCYCECGESIILIGGNLRSKNTFSCGCMQRELLGARQIEHGHTSGRSTGRPNSPEYHSWTSMIQRCTNPNRKHWKNYGGRGISVYPAWRESFTSFLADLGPRPEGTSLDRVDVNGNYEPGNVRWADDSTQARNRRYRLDFDTHCVHGHPWTADSTRIDASGCKVCKICAHDRVKSSRHAG